MTLYTTCTRGRHYYYSLLYAETYIKETAIPDKDNIRAMLSLHLSLRVFQLMGLHYRLCYSIKFIITLNVGLGLQLFGQNS